MVVRGKSFVYGVSNCSITCFEFMTPTIVPINANLRLEASLDAAGHYRDTGSHLLTLLCQAIEIRTGISSVVSIVSIMRTRESSSSEECNWILYMARLFVAIVLEKRRCQGMNSTGLAHQYFVKIESEI